MHLSDYDLKQLNEDGLRKLPAEPLIGLSVKLLADLKEARDRLNRNPQNSSQPPSSQAPWEKVDSSKDEDVTEDVAVDLPDPPQPGRTARPGVPRPGRGGHRHPRLLQRRRHRLRQGHWSLSLRMLKVNPSKLVNLAVTLRKKLSLPQVVQDGFLVLQG